MFENFTKLPEEMIRSIAQYLPLIDHANLPLSGC